MRHGQTLFNLQHKIQGWCDAPLTPLGIKQAQMAKEYFTNITLDHAYASTSERASDTLEIITDMPYTRLKGLKEMNFGVFEGERNGRYFLDFTEEKLEQLLKKHTGLQQLRSFHTEDVRPDRKEEWLNLFLQKINS